MPRRKRPDPLAQTIGQRLRQLRQEGGLTAEKVAYESDVGSKGYLSDIENGLALPSLRTLERLAVYFEVELFDLLVQPESGPRAQVVDKTRHLGQLELKRLLRQLEPSAGALAASPARPALRAVRCYPALEVAAGWTRVAQATGRVASEFVRLPGPFDRSRDFAVRAFGTSMQGWRNEIRHGDWLVLRWTNSGLRAADGRVALIAREDKFGDRSLHIKRVACSPGRIVFRSDDPSVAPVTATDADSILALLRAVVRPESIAPRAKTEFADRSVARTFGLRSAPKAPWSRVDGHLFVFARSSDADLSSISAKVTDVRPAETAFVLGRAGANLRYLGLAQFDEERGKWAVRKSEVER